MSDTMPCRKLVGGSIGCTTYCTKVAGHLGDCEWHPTCQALWNALITTRRELAAASEEGQRP